MPRGPEIGRPDGVKTEMLPLPPGAGKWAEVPQPKFPNQALPRGSMVTPIPPPRSPPPRSGDRGVPYRPSAGCPLGFSTTLKREELGVPCTTLLVIHA